MTAQTQQQGHPPDRVDAHFHTTRGKKMEPSSPRRRDHNAVSNAAIFDAIEDLKQDLAGLTRRFDALPESFTPRREATEITDRMKDRQQDLAERMAGLEKWRLEQIEAQHRAEIAALQQIGTVTTSTTTNIAQAQLSTAQQLASGQIHRDDRIISMLWGALTGGGLLIAGALLTHLLH